jgi:hypothetical protein
MQFPLPTANQPILNRHLYNSGKHFPNVSPFKVTPFSTPIIPGNGSASQFHDNQDSPLYFVDEDEDYYEITCKKKRSRLRKLYLALIKLGYLRHIKKTVKRQRQNR